MLRQRHPEPERNGRAEFILQVGAARVIQRGVDSQF